MTQDEPKSRRSRRQTRPRTGSRPLGDRIRKHRTKLGLSQENVAHQVDRSEGWLIQVENGRADPSYSDLLELARVLQVDLRELVTGRTTDTGGQSRGGELEAQERLRRVLSGSPRADMQVVDHLHRLLADWRALDDLLGPRALLPLTMPVCDPLRTTAIAGLAVVGASAAPSGIDGGGTGPGGAALRPLELPGRPTENTIAGLENLVTEYRRAYGQTPAAALLPRAAGLVHILVDLERAVAPADRGRLVSILGQAALLTGLVSLMGPHDLPAARSYYELALRAASEAGDTDLATNVQGSLSFHDTRAGRAGEGLDRIRAVQGLVDDRTSPMTRAWLSSLASELHAGAGDELECRRCLEQAQLALDADDSGAPAWKGIGWFDESKLIAYQGGDLVLLGQGREAEALLVRALGGLGPSRVKHRCTALGDLALALALQGEVEQACRNAGEALDLAVQLGHAESVARVRRVHRQLRQWKTHPAVRDLGDRLLLAT